MDPQAQSLTPHDAAMVAKVDAAQAATTAATAGAPIGAPAAAPAAPAADAKARPADIPEKFWDAEKGEVRVAELVKSYAELEKGKQPAPAEAPKAPEAAPVVDGKPNMQALAAEFAANGSLSDASLKALEAVGIDKATVDAYVEGQKALHDTRTERALAAVGGRAQFDTMASWASANLPAAEVDAINASLAGSEAQMSMALAGLRARFEAANGREPQLLKGQAAAAVGDTPFASRSEVTTAMRDPRYRSDPAYRAQVERRIGAMASF